MYCTWTQDLQICCEAELLRKGLPRLGGSWDREKRLKLIIYLPFQAAYKCGFWRKSRKRTPNDRRSRDDVECVTNVPHYVGREWHFRSCRLSIQILYINNIMVGAQLKGCILVWMCGDHCYIKTSWSLALISMTFSIQIKLSKHCLTIFHVSAISRQ